VCDLLTNLVCYQQSTNKHWWTLKIFRPILYYPGRGNNNHPLATFEAGTRQFQYGDDDSSAGSDNDLDDDLQQAELAQGQISEALSLEVCLQCSLYIWDSSLFHRDLPGRPQLPLVYPLRLNWVWWWTFMLTRHQHLGPCHMLSLQDSAMMSQVSTVFIQWLFDSGLTSVPLPKVRKGAAPSVSPWPAEMDVVLSNGKKCLADSAVFPSPSCYPGIPSTMSTQLSSYITAFPRYRHVFDVCQGCSFWLQLMVVNQNRHSFTNGFNMTESTWCKISALVSSKNLLWALGLMWDNVAHSQLLGYPSSKSKFKGYFQWAGQHDCDEDVFTISRSSIHRKTDL